MIIPGQSFLTGQMGMTPVSNSIPQGLQSCPTPGIWVFNRGGQVLPLEGYLGSSLCEVVSILWLLPLPGSLGSGTGEAKQTLHAPGLRDAHDFCEYGHQKNTEVRLSRWPLSLTQLS